MHSNIIIINTFQTPIFKQIKDDRMTEKIDELIVQWQSSNYRDHSLLSQKTKMIIRTLFPNDPDLKQEYKKISFWNDQKNWNKLRNESIELLKVMKEQLEIYSDPKLKSNPLQNVFLIFDKFHKIVKQMRIRRKNKGKMRETLNVRDEYDVQDLLHSLFHLFFDDIRPEEWTPSYAGGASRMDFLLKNEKIIVEVKKSRDTMTAKDLGDQLIIDIEKYKKHPDCRKLICFVYDPEGFIPNPKGIENDLSRNQDNVEVVVLIKPD